MKSKLKLNQLKVQSFVTGVNEGNIKGGTNTADIRDLALQLSNALQCVAQVTTATHITYCEPVCPASNPVECRTSVC